MGHAAGCPERAVWSLPSVIRRDFWQSRVVCQGHPHRKRVLVGDLADLWGRLKPEKRKSTRPKLPWLSLCTKGWNQGRLKRKSPGFTSWIPYISSPPSTVAFWHLPPSHLSAWCTCSEASTACCSVTSSCTRRPAAPPSPARRPAARPGPGSSVCGTAPRRAACPGRAALSEGSSSSSRPPVTHDHVGDTAIALKC